MYVTSGPPSIVLAVCLTKCTVETNFVAVNLHHTRDHVMDTSAIARVSETEMLRVGGTVQTTAVTFERLSLVKDIVDEVIITVDHIRADQQAYDVGSCSTVVGDSVDATMIIGMICE